MPALTRIERGKFTSEQIAQIDRFSDSRRDEALGVDASRQRFLSRYVAMPSDQLRARVNVLRVSGGEVEYAPENDYTVTEMQTIADVGLDGNKWLFRIPEILAAGPSAEQRLTAGGL